MDADTFQGIADLYDEEGKKPIDKRWVMVQTDIK
jgi:hypothetical protein